MHNNCLPSPTEVCAWRPPHHLHIILIFCVGDFHRSRHLRSCDNVNKHIQTSNSFVLCVMEVGPSDVKCSFSCNWGCRTNRKGWCPTPFHSHLCSLCLLPSAIVTSGQTISTPSDIFIYHIQP